MQQHEIIEMIEQEWRDRLEAAVEAEREACLKICEAQASTNYWEGADVCADAIRARGTNEQFKSSF